MSGSLKAEKIRGVASLSFGDYHPTNNFSQRTTIEWKVDGILILYEDYVGIDYIPLEPGVHTITVRIHSYSEYHSYKGRTETINTRSFYTNGPVTFYT
jgi:hypothetical protein